MSAPGDVFFVEQHDWVSWWIRFAQKRKWGSKNPVALWNHCGLVVGTDGEVIQANPGGMGAGNLTEYALTQTTILRPPYQPAWEDSGLVHLDGSRIACAAMEELLANHDHYGWWTIFSVALTLMTGTRLRFGVANCLICSGAVSYALTRANIDVGDDSDWNSPSDLMDYALTGKWQVIA